MGDRDNLHTWAWGYHNKYKVEEYIVKLKSFTKVQLRAYTIQGLLREDKETNQVVSF